VGNEKASLCAVVGSWGWFNCVMCTAVNVHALVNNPGNNHNRYYNLLWVLGIHPYHICFSDFFVGSLGQRTSGFSKVSLEVRSRSCYSQILGFALPPATFPRAHNKPTEEGGYSLGVHLGSRIYNTVNRVTPLAGWAFITLLFPATRTLPVRRIRGGDSANEIDINGVSLGEYLSSGNPYLRLYFSTRFVSLHKHRVCE